MIKAIFFDLDGTLVDTKLLHKKSLQIALEKLGVTCYIDEMEGMSTRAKLDRLTLEQGLPIELHDEIFNLKQELTFTLLKDLKPAKNIIDMFEGFNYPLACCSNAIAKTVNLSLEYSDYLKYFDLILSNEDVINPKPAPDIYLSAVDHFELTSEECLVVEDADRGCDAALSAGCHLLRVRGPEDLSLQLILDKIESIN